MAEPKEDELQKRAREIKKALLDREREFAGALATVWAALSNQIGALFEHLFKVMKNVKNTAPSQVSKQDLLDLEITQAAIVQTLYYADLMAAQWADMIEARDREAINDAESDGNELLEVATAAAIIAMLLQSEITTTTYMLPTGVIDGVMAGVFTGQELREILLSRVGEFLNDAIGTLAEATTGSASAQAAAAEALTALSKLADTAAIIGGDQAAKAYREALLAVYSEAAKEIPIIGYRRVSKRDDRVCPACMVLDGKFYKLGETFAEHTRGRCIAVPVFEGDEKNPDYFTGQKWFKTLDADQQLRILGPGRFELWKDGKLQLDDLVSIVGATISTVPIKDTKKS